jgi:magnesium chelatase subunit D
MTDGVTVIRKPWDQAVLAAALLCIDPPLLGGIAVRARAGVVRERWIKLVERLLHPGSPMRRVPLHIADGRLLGGLDLAATLTAGRPVSERGLLSEADGGIIVLQSAERLDSSSIARITGAMDQGKIDVARDGFSFEATSRVGVIAFDEGIADDEGPPAALLDRLAFRIDLESVRAHQAVVPDDFVLRVAAARARAGSVEAGDDIVVALCQAALAMGINSSRAVLLALNVSRAAAALDGRSSVTEADATLAAELVLAPRATMFPSPEPAPDEQQNQPDPPPPEEPDNQDQPDNPSDGIQELADMVLEAAMAAIPPGLLASLRLEQSQRIRSRTSGRAGAKQKSAKHGRPLGARRGELRAGARLNVIETLRAAAMWQPLRRRERALRSGGPEPLARRVDVRKDDFRITHFRNQTETTTIFVVDASGSAALNRLAEAKGAVELLLADCYVRRDRVALIAFRGKTAELLLPPTRSLVRAKRSLAGLPGGGSTPVAHGLDAAALLCDVVRRKGQVPTVIVLTDGRANIARNGAPGRPQAEADAEVSARALALAGISALVIDTSPKPAQQSERLAAAMDAVYLPLPYADASVLSKAVRATVDGRQPARPQLGSKSAWTA